MPLHHQEEINMIDLPLLRSMGFTLYMFFTTVGAVCYLLFASRYVLKLVKGTYDEIDEECRKRKFNRRWRLRVDQLLNEEPRHDRDPTKKPRRQRCCWQRRKRLLTLQYDEDRSGCHSSSASSVDDFRSSQVATAAQASASTTERSAAERGRHSATSSSNSAATVGKLINREKTMLQQQQPMAASTAIGANGLAQDHVGSQVDLPLMVRAKEASLVLSYAALAAAELEICGCDWKSDKETFHWLLSVEEDVHASADENIREGRQLVASVDNDAATSRIRQSRRQPSCRSCHYLICLEMTSVAGAAAAAADPTGRQGDEDGVEATRDVDAGETDAEDNDGFCNVMAALELLFNESSLQGGSEMTQRETGSGAPARSTPVAATAEEQARSPSSRCSNAI
jgi:hypothetical protein